MHVALDLGDQVLDIAGRLLAGLGKRAHFIGNDGKALAVLPGVGGFDGGIEREQIGLVRNAPDGLDDIADARGLTLQFADHRDRSDLAMRGLRDVVDEFGDLRAGLAHQDLCRLAALLAGFRILELPGDSTGNLLESDQRFLRGAGRLFGPHRDLLGGLLELLGGRGGFIDARDKLRGGRCDTLGDLLLLGERAGALAAGLGLARGGG